MEVEYIEIILTAIVSIVGSGAFVTYLNRKNSERDSIAHDKESSATATEKVVKAAGELVEITKGVIQLKEDGLHELMHKVDILTSRVSELETTVNTLEARYSYLLNAARKLLRGMEILLTQLDSYGKKPLWVPSQDIRELILNSEEAKENRG